MTISILIGDVRQRLAELPADHFDCVVTSPPYWGLRDYGVPGQIGLERTLGEHLGVMVDVMREVRRVLQPTGSLWLNYGDCYATSPNGRSAADTKLLSPDDRTFRDKPFSTIGAIYAPDARDEDRRGHRSTLEGPQTLNTPGRICAGGMLKAKDLCMVPNRLAIALQDDGWWVRSEIIWGKLNPMPESIRDRPATAHEKIFLLTKSARYFWNADAVRQAGSLTSHGGTPNEGGPKQQALGQQIGGNLGIPARRPPVGGLATGDSEHSARSHNTSEGKNSRKQAQIAAASAAAGGSSGRRMGGFNERWEAKERGLTPRHEGHVNHTTLDDTGRGEGRNLRNYEPPPMDVWPMATRPFSEAHFATFPPELVERCLAAGCPPGGRVLDPFGGAGTTALVADRLSLDCTLIELNPAYAEIAKQRIGRDAGMFADVSVSAE